MKVSRRERRLAWAAALAAVGYGAYLAVVVPVLNWRQERADDLARLQAELAGYQASLRQQAEVEQRYRQVQVDMHQQRTNVQEIAALLQQLGTMRGPLADKGTKVLATEESGLYRKFRVAMEVEGKAESLADFLRNIAAARAPLKVEHLKLIPSAALPGGVHGTLVVSAVYAGQVGK